MLLYDVTLLDKQKYKRDNPNPVLHLAVQRDTAKAERKRQGGNDLCKSDMWLHRSYFTDGKAARHGYVQPAAARVLQKHGLQDLRDRQGSVHQPPYCVAGRGEGAARRRNVLSEVRHSAHEPGREPGRGDAERLQAPHTRRQHRQHGQRRPNPAAAERELRGGPDRGPPDAHRRVARGGSERPLPAALRRRPPRARRRRLRRHAAELLLLALRRRRPRLVLPRAAARRLLEPRRVLLPGARGRRGPVGLRVRALRRLHGRRARAVPAAGLPAPARPVPRPQGRGGGGVRRLRRPHRQPAAGGRLRLRAVPGAGYGLI